MRVVVPLPFDVSSLAHGRSLRVVNLLRELGKWCEVRCVAADDAIAGGASALLPEVEIICARANNGTVEPRTPAICRSRWLNRALEFFGHDRHLWAEIARQSCWAEVILGFDLPSAVYLTAVAGRSGKGPRTACDLIDDPWLTLKSSRFTQRFSPSGLKAAASMAIIRRQLLGQFDALTAVARRDAQSLSRATGREVVVVPNGVAVPQPSCGPGGRETLVVFTGAMSFPPNEAAAVRLVRRIWPMVSQRVPSATLAIVGADPSLRVQQLAVEPGVMVTGRVAEVGSWLQRARVAVAPMVSGCGMKNKVLEACAAGCPVVATSLGAAGLPRGEEHGIVVADQTGQFAERIITLLQNSSAGMRIGAAGQAMVRERFSWSQSAIKLYGVLAGICDEATNLELDLVGTSEPQLLQISSAGCPRYAEEEALTHAAS